MQSQFMVVHIFRLFLLLVQSPKSAKEQIINDLKNTYTIASVTPVIVDPVTTFIRLGVNLKYNKKSTTKTSRNFGK